MKTLAGIRRSIPESCYEISPVKSWITVARILAMLSACLYLETQTENIFYLFPLWFMHGQILVGLFVLGHDCGHNTFSKNKTVNLIMGHAAFSPLGNGLINWTVTHNHHHAHTQLRGQDVDWSKWLMTEKECREARWKKNFAGKLGYLLPFGVFFWIWLNAIGRGFKNTSSRVRVSNLIMWSVMLTLYAGLAWFTGFSGLFKYHGIPATIAMLTGYFLLTIQHANEKSKWFEESSWTPVRGQMESTFDVRFPRLFEWLWLDINIHVPHHVSPAIPWYELRNARLALKRDHPELYQERKFSFLEVKWMIRTPVLMKGSDTYSMREF
jgi:omega-6 fatty acid desaturase (delta-12 desaturase)